MFEKKTPETEKKESEKKNVSNELDFDDLDAVQGGAGGIRDVQFTETTPISDDTRSKI